MPKISQKWKRMSEAYVYSTKSFNMCDFSEKSARDMFDFESTGEPKIVYYEKYHDGLYNGYVVGKHWYDVNLSFWIEDLRSGLITKYELLSNNDIPEIVKEKIKTLPLI